MSLPKPSLWLPFRESYANQAGLIVTPNMGTLGGAATMGDGSTANTIPATIQNRRGVSCAATAYVNAGMRGPTNGTTPYSVFISLPGGPLGGVTVGGTAYLFDSEDSANGTIGMHASYSYAINTLYFGMYAAGATGYRNAYNSTGIVSAGPSTLALVNAGTGTAAGLSVYRDAKKLTASATDRDNYAGANCDSGRNILINAYWAGATATPNAVLSLSSVLYFPAALSPTQIAYLHQRLMAEACLP